MTLDKLRPWIEAQDAPTQEAARLLRWANMIANGRLIPIEKQSDATRMPSTCYSFQPERKTIAKRVGVIRDFRKEQTQPLAGRSEEHTSELQSLMRISYAVFCLKKKKQNKHNNTRIKS